MVDMVIGSIVSVIRTQILCLQAMKRLMIVDQQSYLKRAFNFLTGVEYDDENINAYNFNADSDDDSEIDEVFKRTVVKLKKKPLMKLSEQKTSTNSSINCYLKRMDYE